MKGPRGSAAVERLRPPVPWWLSRGAGSLLVALLVAVAWTLVWSSAASSVHPVANFDRQSSPDASVTPTSYVASASTRPDDVTLTTRGLRSDTTQPITGTDADEELSKQAESPDTAARRELLLRRAQRRDRQLAAFIRSVPAVPATWVSPLAAPYRITATFGAAGSLWSADHTGVDLATPTGTPVAAVSAGTVTSAGDSGAYGLRVTITHPDGTQSMYAHLSRIDISVGQDVEAGEPVGAVGTTGNSTGPHLHLEVRSSAGVPIDPVKALRARGVEL